MSSSTSAPQPTRQNTSRHELPPTGTAIFSTMTFDIFERLARRNRREHPSFLRETTGSEIEEGASSGDSSLGNDSDEEGSEAGGEKEHLLDLYHVWEGGRRLRLIGTLQRQHAARLQPLLDARDAAWALKAADKAFPKDKSPRPTWTEMERAREDTIVPYDRVYSHTEALEEGFLLVDWQGRDMRPIPDRTRLVIAVAAGRPPGPKGLQIIADATAAFEHAALIGTHRPAPAQGFVSVAAGIEYLEGIACPSNMRAPNVIHAFAIDHLVKHVAVRRLCSFANARCVAPNAFLTAVSLTDNIFKLNPILERIGPGVWTGVIFNLRPQPVTPLQDLSRRIICWLWIAITALGNFDADHGGHLILWDLGRVLRFPSGASVLLPAILRYSIAGIREGETR